MRRDFADPVHPSLFLVLFLPYGAVSGYLTVTIGYLLACAGFNSALIAAIIAFSYIPATFMFLWAPLADVLLTPKRWYVIGTGGTAVSIALLGFMPLFPQVVGLLYLLVLLAGATATLSITAVERLMAYDTGDREKGRVAGWSQAGNVGGMGIGGGLGLWLAEILPQPWMSGLVIAGGCLASCAVLPFIPDNLALPALQDPIGKRLSDLLGDVWALMQRRTGFLALLILILPLGTGAASNLFAAVSGDWGASVTVVLLVTGVVGGTAATAGAVIGGYHCDRIDRKKAYLLYGLMGAGCTAAMAAAPRTEMMFVIFTMAYQFIMGLTYAAFAAVALEATGRGAAATKFSIFFSLANVPIAVMSLIDGWAHTRLGTSGMLCIEALAALLAIVFFHGMARMTERAKSWAV